MSKKWLIQVATDEFLGPYTIEEIREGIRGGQILPSMKVVPLSESLKDLSDVDEVFFNSEIKETPPNTFVNEPTVIIKNDYEIPTLPDELKNDTMRGTEPSTKSSSVASGKTNPFFSRSSKSKKNSTKTKKNDSTFGIDKGSNSKSGTRSKTDGSLAPSENEDDTMTNRPYILIDANNGKSANLSLSEVLFLYEREIIDKNVKVALKTSPIGVPLEVFVQTCKEALNGNDSDQIFTKSKNKIFKKGQAEQTDTFWDNILLIFIIIVLTGFIYWVITERQIWLEEIKSGIIKYNKISR